MPALPGSLALTNIAPGSDILSSDHRTNYAAIQAAVNALVALLANGVLDGDPMVWDFTNAKWAAASTLGAGRPRAPRMTVSAMSGGPPASPSDQDIWVATGVDANGTRWTFQYNAGSASAYKWEFIGGNETYIRPAIANYVAGGAFVYTNSGLILARAGDYRLKIHAMLTNNTPVTPAAITLIGGVGGAAVFARQAAILIANGGNISDVHWEDVGAGLAAATNLQVAVASGAQPWAIGQCLVQATPIRVS